MNRLALIAVITGTLLAGGCRLKTGPGPSTTSGRRAAADSANASVADSAGGAASDSAGAGRASPLPTPDLGYNAREGRALYGHYCLFCHGDEGRGDGFNAYNLDPRPRSLADSTFQAGRSDDELAAAIRSGGGAVGLSTGMPPWGRTLNERKIRNVVEYLRTLRAKRSPGH